MKGIKVGYLIIALMAFNFSTAQNVEINGKVIVDDEEVEGIHVINKTANKFTITKDNGVFTVPVNLHDTIIFSGIKYKSKEVIVTAEIIRTKILNVYLTEQINELDEVIVGKILTGNLLLDIGNSEAKRDLNFYDLGIPGYTGKPFTITENRFNEATTGGGIVPLNPLLNYLSGRTKQLKYQMKIERLNDCLERIKSDLSELFFTAHELDEVHRAEFFYFCMEDEAFSTLCALKNDLRTLEFLADKLENYKTNLQSAKD